MLRVSQHIKDGVQTKSCRQHVHCKSTDVRHADSRSSNNSSKLPCDSSPPALTSSSLFSARRCFNASRRCDISSAVSGLHTACHYILDTASRDTAEERMQLQMFCNATHYIMSRNPHTHTTILRPFFRDHPSEPVPEKKLLDIMVQGKINRGRHTDHPAGRHSILTSQCPPPPSPNFFDSSVKYQLM